MLTLRAHQSPARNALLLVADAPHWFVCATRAISLRELESYARVDLDQATRVAGMVAVQLEPALSDLLQHAQRAPDELRDSEVRATSALIRARRELEAIAQDGRVHPDVRLSAQEALEESDPGAA